MARRRDVRRFGPGPYLLGLRRGGAWGDGFPFDVPAVAAVEDLALDAPVTLLAGDNGCGKSTLIEAMAAAMGFGAEGGELERYQELPAVPRAVLGGALEPVPRRAHLRARRQRPGAARLRPARERQADARLPRRAGALPARRARA